MNIRNSNLNFGSNKSYGNTPKSIVLHHAEASNCSVYDVHQWHKNNGWAGIGYHYFVRKNGEVWKGRSDNVVGSHVAGFNQDSLGICAEGSYMTEAMPQSQKNAIIELCKYLCSKYSISKIYGHREVGSSNCPGTRYPLTEIRNAILNNKSIQKEEEKKKVENIVIYNEGADRSAAEYLADFLQCPTISNSRPFDYSCVENVFAVGNKKENYTSHLKVLLTGGNRYTTMQAVLDYIKKNSK
ncbi:MULTISPECIES: peptidoglycan recognition protein family protein [Clostridium]|uniref:peptidoglycan recognition protein family protein n=1 Tax=Clostridium TaxID=1485 RepID=UPI000773E789|nr:MULTISPECIES: peptidoglycan recognition family protein [Clostridium]AUM96136.1 N-acetylmuramoyl-L-alanine amidase [Clostridium sporogenes]AVQ53587.1 N-acetylmuramoyl-L-alanine amidase [Clostridium botulinum]